jgi:hypothetical protein
MEFRLSRSFSHEIFYFFTMEFWLSRSLSHEHFSFFHDGILAITKPFSRTFFFFHDGILAITKSFSWTFFFFHDGILAITKPFSRTFFFFHDVILTITIWGETLFIYITKSIYIGSASLKTLPLDLEPLCKEKSTVLLILIQLGKEKLMFFPKSLIDTWFGFLS